MASKFAKPQPRQRCHRPLLQCLPSQAEISRPQKRKWNPPRIKRKTSRPGLPVLRRRSAVESGFKAGRETARAPDRVIRSLRKMSRSVVPTRRKPRRVGQGDNRGPAANDPKATYRTELQLVADPKKGTVSVVKDD